MRKVIIFIVMVSFLGCNETKNQIPKPKKMIDAEVMENILYDLSLLQALKSTIPEKLSQNKINPKTYIYKKYKIDSIQFVENNKYYALDIDAYKKMFSNVNERLIKQKSEIDTILKKEQKLKQKRYRDSVTKKTSKRKILIQG